VNTQKEAILKLQNVAVLTTIKMNKVLN